MQYVLKTLKGRFLGHPVYVYYCLGGGRFTGWEVEDKES